MKNPPLKVALIGYGRMGRRHADVYEQSENFDLAAICLRLGQRKDAMLAHPNTRFFTDFGEMITNTKPDLVCISTHVETHDELARFAMENGAHVFLEKPATTSFASARELVAYANRKEVKLIVGYILQHDFLWQAFIDECRKLENPLHIVCHLDQHSAGEEWKIHKKILRSSSIAYDCAIHFFDIFAQAIESVPTTVEATGHNTHEDLTLNDNSVDVAIEFENGSSGRYLSSWGPGFKEDPVWMIRASGQNGVVSIIEEPGRSEVVSEACDGSKAVIYSNPQHLTQATEMQQTFVREVILGNLDLTEHHDRVLLTMRLAELADKSASTLLRLSCHV